MVSAVERMFYVEHPWNIASTCRASLSPSAYERIA